MNNKLINWKQIYQKSGSFHIYFTSRKRGKSDTKAWSLLESIISDKEIRHAWIRRRWHDSLDCTKPYFEDLIYKFCEEKGINRNVFEIKEKGVYYHQQRRLYFSKGTIIKSANCSQKFLVID